MRNTMILAGLAIVLAGNPVSAEESLSPETLLPAAGDRDAYWPAAACGKDNYLVVWQAGRDVPGGNGGDIVGCRVDKSGKTLDAAPIVIGAAKDEQEQPQVAFGSGTFLVVWQDLRNGKDYDVYASRVTPEGKTLDPEGLLVSGGPKNQCLPRVVHDGKTFLVVWADQRSGFYETWGARVTSEGKLVDAQGFTVAAGPPSKYTPLRSVRFDPVVAAAGDGASLVFWTSNGWAWERGVPDGLFSGSHFVRDGKPAEAAVIKPPRGGRSPYPAAGCSPLSLAKGAKSYLITWRNVRPVGRGGGTTATNALLLDAAGKPSGEPFGLEGSVMETGAAWDGSAYVAAWGRLTLKDGNRHGPASESVAATRLGEDGKPVGKTLEVSGTFASPASRPAVASDGAGTSLIAYEKHPEKGDVPIKIGFRMLSAK
jgi:hypothetical protein